jgi:hypothetical protein
MARKTKFAGETNNLANYKPLSCNAIILRNIRGRRLGEGVGRELDDTVTKRRKASLSFLKTRTIIVLQKSSQSEHGTPLARLTGLSIWTVSVCELNSAWKGRDRPSQYFLILTLPSCKLSAMKYTG